MPEYGLTLTGPNIKRLDVIEDEIHTQLSEQWGVNTRQNPESFLCHLIRNIADQIADLWVYGSDVYYSQYPNSAEGKNLDTAVQYGGIVRERAQKSYYRILCTGIDGTTIPAGTIIASDTNPPVNLTISENAAISSGNFNKARVIVAEPGTTSTMSIQLNGTVYPYEPVSGNTDKQNLEGLAAVLNRVQDLGFTVSVEEDDDGAWMNLVANDAISSNAMILSENLTTSVVGSIVMFATVDDGDILIPEGVINKVVRAVVGLQTVENVGTYIAGREQETDTELRQSYVDKIFKRSSAMVESIRSNILDNVQGVTSCAVYENDTNEVDEEGRWPHSVEVVADGTFDETELAQVILDTKAGGINTYACLDDPNNPDMGHEVVLPGEYGEPITIRYNSPQKIFVWYNVDVKFNTSINVPQNYSELIEGVILDWMGKLKAGDDVSPQRFLGALYETVPGVDYFEIGMYSTTQESAEPSASDFTEKIIEVTPRQKAVTDDGRIEVGLI